MLLFTVHAVVLSDSLCRVRIQVAFPDADTDATFHAMRRNARSHATEAAAQDMELPASFAPLPAWFEPRYSKLRSPGIGAMLQLSMTLRLAEDKVFDEMAVLAIPQAWLIGSPADENEALASRLQRDGWLVRIFGNVEAARAQLRGIDRAPPAPAFLFAREGPSASVQELRAWAAELPSTTRVVLGMPSESDHRRLAQIGRLEIRKIPFSPADLGDIREQARQWEIDRGDEVAPAPRDAEHRPRVLVADHDPANLVLASEMLRVLSYASDTAVSGLDAIEYCQRFRPVAILMDVQMPDMSGIEATQRLRRMEAHQTSDALHIIGATTQNDEETRAACMLAGMNGFLHKPLGPLNLAHQIGTAVPRAARPSRVGVTVAPLRSRFDPAASDPSPA
ncbi:response regulator [Schlegelella sp. S2-27]|uniref:Response regulator n=1 Tax=Caldimonas mangrovi TaxID=2944811 RepID=A0ABT0YJB0_9BURK|nr:response regulator [Caldimonas mangrovi]MCM5678241.1 response regulator [Caldimonas mangrovi]